MKRLVSCPVCGNKRLIVWGRTLLAKDDTPADLALAENQLLLAKLKLDKYERALSLCLSCSFLFQNPTYDGNDLKNIYDPDNVGYAEISQKVGKTPKDLWDSDRGRENTQKRQERYGKLIQSFKSTRILDYGGGKGENLLSETIKNTERYVFNFGVSDLAGDDLKLLPGLTADLTFDFILHTHVLEHEPDPAGSLSKLREIIEPQGVLYIELPFEYWERFITRRPGAIWHVNYFNRNTLIMTANKAGWVCTDIEIKLRPYSNNIIPCLSAVLRPRHDSTSRGATHKLINYLYDFMKFAQFRAVGK